MPNGETGGIKKWNFKMLNLKQSRIPRGSMNL
nr:MAG TPA: hypothetical protein [Caudoviricetes sp.]